MEAWEGTAQLQLIGSQISGTTSTKLEVCPSPKAKSGKEILRTNGM
jgi:hypothetical protein